MQVVCYEKNIGAATEQATSKELKEES